MQIGSRWAAGAAPHPQVPSELHDAIATAEIAMRTDPTIGSAGPSSWTLTWLEGRPVCTLDHRVRVTVSSTGTVRVDSLGSDGQVVGARLSEVGTSSAAAEGAAIEFDDDDDDDDDDDWLN